MRVAESLKCRDGRYAKREVNMSKLDDKIVEVIFENSADSVVVTDKEGVIQFVNKAFIDITGYSSEEAIGKTPRILKSEKHEKEFYKDVWNIILSGQRTRVVFINQRKSGEEYYHEEIITPVMKNDEVDGFVSCGRDITELLTKRDQLEEYVKFVDTVFETMSSQMAAFKLIKDVKYK